MIITRLLVLLACLQSEPADYFLAHRTSRGLMLDRSDNPNVVSVAASGFAMPAWAILAAEGRLAKEAALKWSQQCFRETLRVNAANRGWLYHFTDLDGKPVYNEEVSSIDSALFYLGAREAARMLGDATFSREVEAAIASVDVAFMLENGGEKVGKKYFSHGFIRAQGKPHFLECDWRDYSEGVLLYRLFGVPYEHPPVAYDLPLFTYFYPLCFYDEQAMREYLGLALDDQLEKLGSMGHTACNGPGGYGVMEANVISPLALSCCEVFFPDKVKDAIERLPGRTVPAYDVTTRESITTRIAIDDGAYVLLKFKYARGR